MSSIERTRFALFDSLRAIAALAVVVFHTAVFSRVLLESRWAVLLAHLNVGVALFFLISGFLLYRPYALALVHGSESSPRLAAYAKRRFLRIVPAYWVALTLLALWPGLPRVLTSDWWVYYGLLQSFGLEWALGGIAPVWSLSVEAAYYALLPLLALAISRFASGRPPQVRVRLALGALCVLGAAGFAFRAASRYTGYVELISSMPAFLHWFAAGMALAVASVWLADDARRSRAARLVIDHPGLCWTLAVFCLSPLSPTPLSGRTAAADAVEHLVYTVVATLVMAPAIFGEGAGGLPRRVLASRALTKIGVASYGIFLWHHPLLTALPRLGLDRLVPGSRFASLVLVIVPLAIACGWLSHRFVEQPAMRLAQRSRAQHREE